MNDENDVFSAIKVVVAVSGHVAALADDVAMGEVVGHRYAIVDLDAPASARLFSNIDELKEEAEEIAQRSLMVLGGARYVRAIAEDSIDVDQFLGLAGEDGPAWLARGEEALLGASIVAASTAGHSQRRL